MPALEETLLNAAQQIRACMEREMERQMEREDPLHDPRMDAMVRAIHAVGSLVPVRNPSLGERSALAEYRRALQQLQPALHRLSGRLLEARATMQEQSERLRVLRVYGRAAADCSKLGV